mmetsp:Transcript_1016/g.2394  ORF Transcript_1016/g.2394 Transcript_1016/m.2394 type:complete len:120 (-) Transcript_1016:315-674(-)
MTLIGRGALALSPRPKGAVRIVLGLLLAPMGDAEDGGGTARAAAVEPAAAAAAAAVVAAAICRWSRIICGSIAAAVSSTPFVEEDSASSRVRPLSLLPGDDDDGDSDPISDDSFVISLR